MTGFFEGKRENNLHIFRALIIPLRTTETVHDAKKRYTILCSISYGVPILLLIITGIFEALGLRCSIWRPRFNEELCFFTGNNLSNKSNSIAESFYYVNYYVKGSSNDLSNENRNTGVSGEMTFQK